MLSVDRVGLMIEQIYIFAIGIAIVAIVVVSIATFFYLTKYVSIPVIDIAASSAQWKIINYRRVSKDHISDDNYFIVKVDGDSMSGDGINIGDDALIRRAAFASRGDIAVTLINASGSDRIVSLRRYFVIEQLDNSYWFLEASNPKSKHLVVIPQGSNINEIRQQYERLIKNEEVVFYEDAELTVAGIFVKVLEDS